MGCTAAMLPKQARETSKKNFLPQVSAPECANLVARISNDGIRPRRPRGGSSESKWEISGDVSKMLDIPFPILFECRNMCCRNEERSKNHRARCHFHLDRGSLAVHQRCQNLEIMVGVLLYMTSAEKGGGGEPEGGVK